MTGQARTSESSYAIKNTPALFHLLALHSGSQTIDAMGCKRDITGQTARKR